MKAYSTDLREKLALAYEHSDNTLDEVAELFSVGRRTVTRFVQKQRAGLSLAPQPHAGGYSSVLTAKALVSLRDKVTDTPVATLAELASYLKTKARFCPSLNCLSCSAKVRTAAKKKDDGHLRKRCTGAPSLWATDGGS
jgi:transposase-like protein